MAKKFEDILGESKFGEDQKTHIREAWENKLSEAREEIAANLREEFAQKFEHDKSVLIESIDGFLNDKITQEMEEIAEDKKKLVAERIQYKNKIKEHTKMLNKFIVSELSKEVKDLRDDKAKMTENFNKLENFVLKQLSEEIKDFHNDKKALVEQRVALVREGKAQLRESKDKFIKRAAKAVNDTINKALRSEISQLKEDIEVARHNEFGRKIFEAYASEFTSSCLNEGTMVAKLQKELNQTKSIVESLQSEVQKKEKLAESANAQLKVSKDLAERKEIMSELLNPLSRGQRAIMTDLLESVETKRLKPTFNKYLPAVLNEDEGAKTSNKEVLSESSRVEKTGDKKGTAQNNEIVELADIKKLAGIE